MVRTWTLSLMAAGGLMLGIAGGASANTDRCRTDRLGYTESYRSYDAGYQVYPVRWSDRGNRYDRYDRDDRRDRRRAHELRELREERIERERHRDHWRLERAREERLERREHNRDHRSWDRLHHRWFE
jgi:hypothetical protein